MMWRDVMMARFPVALILAANLDRDGGGGKAGRGYRRPKRRRRLDSSDLFGLRSPRKRDVEGRDLAVPDRQF